MEKIVAITIILFLFSCNRSEKRNDALEQKESKIVSQEDSVEQNFNVNLKVSKNLIYCQNEKLIIRIDRMNDDNLRFTTWNQPKNEGDEPKLIISNGEIEKQGSMGGYIYTFQNGEESYVVEDNQMGENIGSTGRFLILLNNGKVISRTKMKDIK